MGMPRKFPKGNSMAKEMKHNSTGGGKLYEPNKDDRLKVVQMFETGATTEQVAQVLDISVSTVRKHFKKEIRLGKLTANTAVAGALYKNAMKGNVAAQIFWCKAQMGWRDREGGISIDMPDGKDMKTTVTINLKAGKPDKKDGEGK